MSMLDNPFTPGLLQLQVKPSFEGGVPSPEYIRAIRDAWRFHVRARSPRYLSVEVIFPQGRHTHEQNPKERCIGCDFAARAACGRPIRRYHMTIELDSNAPIAHLLGLSAAETMALHAKRLDRARATQIISASWFQMLCIFDTLPEGFLPQDLLAELKYESMARLG